MRLTSDYRRVKALFNTPVGQEIKYDEGLREITTEFTVGPFTYRVSFEPDSRDKTTSVVFELVDINATDEELVEMMSRWSGEQLSLEEAKKVKNRILEYRSIDVLEIMGNYVIKVFSHVFNIIKDYAETYGPRCITCTGSTTGRGNLYHKMARKAFPDAHIEVRPLSWGPGIELTVCF
jgi:hypothetical protein